MININNKVFKLFVIVCFAFSLVFVSEPSTYAQGTFTCISTLSVSNPDTQIDLNWPQGYANAMYYDIYRTEVDIGESNKIKTINVNIDKNYLSFTDTGLKPETAYSYTIKALDANMNLLASAPANTVTTGMMLEPEVLTTNYNINSKAVTLTWINRSQATRYINIIRKSDNTPIAVLSNAATTCTFTDPSVTDNDIINNAVMRYVVVCNDGFSHSSPGISPLAETSVTLLPPPVISVSMQNQNTDGVDDNITSISWDEASIPYINNFCLERSKFGTNTWYEWSEIISDIPAHSLELKDIPSSGGTYRYRLHAKNTGNYSGYSNISEPVTKPAAPSDLTCIMPDIHTVVLSWTNDGTNNSELRIYKKTGSGNYNSNPIAILPKAGDLFPSSYTDTSIDTANDFGTDTDHTYYYKVIAYDSNGNVASSNECSILALIPESPSSLNLTVISSTQIDLKWVSNSHNELGFIVQKKIDSGDFENISPALPAGTTSYSDKMVSTGHTYTYRILAYNALGESAFTNEVSTTTTTIVTPDTLVVTPVSDSRLDLRWTYPISGSYSTLIERKTGTGEWQTIQSSLSPGTTNFSDINLLENTQYYYRIKTVSGFISSTPYPNNDMGKGACTLLKTPTNLTVSITSASEVHLAWIDNSYKETGYIIERKSENEDYSTIAVTNANLTSWTDNDLAPNTRYVYRIKARSMTNTSGYSNEAYVDTPMGAPTYLWALAVSDSSIRISWSDNSSSESGFEIWRKEGISGTWQKYSYTNRNITSFVDNNISENIQYYYMVRAYSFVKGTYIYSPFTNETGTSLIVPAPPSNLQYTVISSTQIKLTWNDNSSSEYGYIVERKTGEDEKWTQITWLSANTTTFSHAGLTPYTQYFYRVKAYKYSSYYGKYSNETEVILGIPSAPSNLSLDVFSSNEIMLAWTDNSANELGFKIERKKANGAYKEIARVDANVTSYYDNSLSQKTKYYYRISAYNKSGNSAYCREVAKYTKSSVNFNDISSQHNVKKAIDNLSSRGIIKGKGDKSFAPDDPITRAEFVSLLVRALDISKTPVGTFSDVKPYHWFYKEVITAKILGIVSGDSSNAFHPDQSLTRQDMAVIAVKALMVIGKPLPAYDNTILKNYQDKDTISEYAVTSIASLLGEKIITAKDNKINPKDRITRGEAAVVIYNIINRQGDFNEK